MTEGTSSTTRSHPPGRNTRALVLSEAPSKLFGIQAALDARGLTAVVREDSAAVFTTLASDLALVVIDLSSEGARELLSVLMRRDGRRTSPSPARRRCQIPGCRRSRARRVTSSCSPAARSSSTCT